jgi:hypothetical protein
MRLGLASSLAVLCSGPASSVTQFARTDSGPGVCVRVCVRTHVHAGTRMHVAKPFEFTHASITHSVRVGDLPCLAVWRTPAIPKVSTAWALEGRKGQ